MTFQGVFTPWKLQLYPETGDSFHKRQITISIVSSSVTRIFLNLFIISASFIEQVITIEKITYQNERINVNRQF